MEADPRSRSCRKGASWPGRGRDQPDGTLYQIFTWAGLVLLAVLVLAFNLNIGFVALTIGRTLALWIVTLQKRAMPRSPARNSC